MFIGLGKMLGKSKIRLGVGFRLTKSNAFYMWIVMGSTLLSDGLFGKSRVTGYTNFLYILFFREVSKI